MFESVKNKDSTIAVLGLGYVGLPLALEFARRFRVIGFDINPDRVALMQGKEDPSGEVRAADFEGRDILFTSVLDDLRDCQVYIVAVPTDIDENKVPDLKPLRTASGFIGQVIKPGDYVIFESTVYPGCTEEECIPVIEEVSGLRLNQDFKAGYSPERINPGDKTRPLASILKIVSGSDEEALENITALYGSIIHAGLHQAPSIKVAEAAKVIENIQRDLNISLMNELSILFDLMEIDTHEVIEAAATKWNFIKFYPGLVGGHCIGVDPYYLLHKAKALGLEPQVIASGRRINDEMPAYIAKKLVQKLLAAGKNPINCRVLILGVTFKENVSDIRNSKVSDLIHELLEYSLQVEAVDPNVDPGAFSREYGFELSSRETPVYDAVIVAVAHRQFQSNPVQYYKDLLDPAFPLLLDLKGIIYEWREGFEYWKL
ncbi:MAG TPA: nucleotide sugar dehydrogenase [Saprospiraceae bacterium]|nr:nucleotide sugar dehydrogenase [Saprospiraceae bacterium]HNT19426.1 nucleotide sugar dehydrogenase [Saprospiraceae bacterium]